MTSKRFDICSPRPKKDGGTYWTKIGTAWEGDKGIQLVFDALPLPDKEGRVVANLFEPREKSASTGNGGGGYKAPTGTAYDETGQQEDLDDSVPFASNDVRHERRVR